MGFEEDFKKINDQLNNFSQKVNDPTIIERLAQEFRDLIVTRTRLGFGGDKFGGTQRKLKKLEPVTRTDRQRAKKKGQLSGDTSPAKSNVTRTGSLLDNTKVKRVTGGYRIAPDDKDQTKAQNLEKIGFKYMVLTRNELRRLDRFFNKLITGIFK